MVIKTGFFDNAQEKQRDKKEVAVRKGVKNMNWKELPAMDDSAGRILSMCPILDIKLDDLCSVMYLTLDEKRKELEETYEEERQFRGFRDGLYRECLDIVDSWLEQDKDRDGYHRCTKYWDENAFLGTCFQYEGYSEGYSYSCDFYHEGLRSSLAMTLALLRTHWLRQ